VARTAQSLLRAQGTRRVSASPKLHPSVSGQDLLGGIVTLGISVLMPEFQRVLGVFCDKRDKVETKLVLLCRVYPSESPWIQAPQIIGQY